MAGTAPIGPAPLQAGGPPLLAAATSPKPLARAARWADGVLGFDFGPDPVAAAALVRSAEAAWREAGRPTRPLCATSFWFALGPGARERLDAYARRYLAVFGEARRPRARRALLRRRRRRASATRCARSAMRASTSASWCRRRPTSPSSIGCWRSRASGSKLGYALRPSRKETTMPTLHDFSARNIDGEETSLRDYAGKVALVVNVASKCGLTPQYAGLEKLYESLRPARPRRARLPLQPVRGAGAGHATPRCSSSARSTTASTFPLFSKIDVNGAQRHPLYAWLTAARSAPKSAGDVKWNFGKFVIGRDGAVLARFAPPTAPDDPALVAAIEKALG